MHYYYKGQDPGTTLTNFIASLSTDTMKNTKKKVPECLGAIL